MRLNPAYKGLTRMAFSANLAAVGTIKASRGRSGMRPAVLSVD